MKPSEKSLQLAAQCWCDEETKNTVMDVYLATAFAERLDKKDEVIKILKEAIRFHHDTWSQVNNDNLCLAECRRVCAALAAVEKLEKE